jgi:hypothetical protein
MHAECVNAGVMHAGEPDIAIRRLALALDWKVDRSFYRSGAISKY